MDRPEDGSLAVSYLTLWGDVHFPTAEPVAPSLCRYVLKYIPRYLLQQASLKTSLLLTLKRLSF